MARKPYPLFRLPGWHQGSAALHLDDCRKFWQNVDGGQDYTNGQDLRPVLDPRTVRAGSVIGCGYDFRQKSLFFTLNGRRLPDAFKGIYSPEYRAGSTPAFNVEPIAHDVYAAIGVCGKTELEVNFGTGGFVWKEAETGGWSVLDHVGRMKRSNPSGSGIRMEDVEELPAYSAI